MIQISFLTFLKIIFISSHQYQVVIIKSCNIAQGREQVTQISKIVEDSLLSFKEFITVKSNTNFSMASYLEEFPGLVHFIHVDRSMNRNRVTAPNIEMASEDTLINLRKKVTFIFLSIILQNVFLIILYFLH